MISEERSGLMELRFRRVRGLRPRKFPQENAQGW